MNHRLYETWILEESELSPTQKQELLEHLKACSKCACMEKSWRAARQQIKSMPAVDAPIGFSSRFQASLAQRRKLQEQRQARVLLISLVSSAVAVMITLGIFLLPKTSLSSVMIGLLSSLLKVLNSITQVWQFMTSLLKAAPPSFLISIGIVSSLLISLLSIIWAVSFLRITMKGYKFTNEN